MSNEKTLDPTVSTLNEFSKLAWRELSAFSPDGRRARRLAGIGVMIFGVSTTSLVLYGIYRALGATLLGPVVAVPQMVWTISAAGVFCGVVLLGVAAVLRHRSMRVLTTADAERRPNGHAVPRGSHTV